MKQVANQQRMSTPDSAIADHISELISRLLYLEELEQLHGSRTLRKKEIAALLWTIGLMGEKFPTELARAEELAEGRLQNRQERQRQG